MTNFVDESVTEAFERSVKNARHLRVRDAPAVAAARALARKIDAWDVIVDWALEDASETKGVRPAVPANDNVSIASFLKYLEKLKLLPPEAEGAGVTGAAGAGVPKQNDLEAMRRKLAGG
ncbi:terminase small subunit [Leucobacter muris]|uniref:terminase small subunit n=1 Tax=Leucobacter muris TaxID=1935379 RepID=UPI00188673C8|nr:hypothetical protein [Leucobacter muris]